MDAPTPYERRMGHRHPVDPVPVDWRLGPAKRRKPPKARAQGELLDLSVSGARVAAPAARDLVVGSRLDIRILDVAGPVIIRRIEPGSSRSESVYGLEFASASSPLTQLVHHDLLSRYTSAQEHQWR